MATTYTDTTVNNLIINQLTSAEYTALENNSQIEADQLYLITDDSVADELSFDGTYDASTNKIATMSSLSGYVPTSRTVAGHALSSNVTLSRSDVSLGNVTNDKQMPIAGGTFTGNAVAYSTNRTTSGLRNIEVRITSATGTLQSTNKIIMVRK